MWEMAQEAKVCQTYTVQMSEEMEIILHSTHFSKGKIACNECLYVLSLCSLILLIFSDTEVEIKHFHSFTLHSTHAVTSLHTHTHSSTTLLTLTSDATTGQTKLNN